MQPSERRRWWSTCTTGSMRSRSVFSVLGRRHSHRQSLGRYQREPSTPRSSTRPRMPSGGTRQALSADQRRLDLRQQSRHHRTVPHQAHLRWWRGRSPSRRQVLNAPDMRGVIIVSGVAYGDGGGGLPGLLLGSPRDDSQDLDCMLWLRRNSAWSTVNVADLAEFFFGLRWKTIQRAAGTSLLTDRTRPLPSSRTPPLLQPVHQERSPAPAMKPGHAWASLSPKSFCSTRAPRRRRPDRELFGWHPSHPTLADEFRHGSYRMNES